MTDNTENILLQIRGSEALEIRFFLDELYVNHYVVYRNFEELKSFLDEVENPEAAARIWKGEELNDAMREVTRLLLNFLASVSARVESSRRMIRIRYEATPFLESYESEVKRRFEGNPLAGFVEGLRNYSLHFALPLAGAYYEFTLGSPMRGGTDRLIFALERDILLSKSFEWKKGRAYLEGSNRTIAIREFTTEYFEAIHSFQLWVQDELYRLHKQEVDWLEEAQAAARLEIEKLMRVVKRYREEEQK